jgi:bacterioferritin-associated ferredoxin
LIGFYSNITMSLIDINSPDEILCTCSGTTRGEIEKLYHEGLDLDGISRRTGALSGCSGCEWEVSEFLKELNVKK